MARRVIGYVGNDSRTRRPVYADEGPARAHGSLGGLAAMTNAAIPERLLPGGHDGIGEPAGSGAVERREATAAQREAWRSRDEERRPSPIAPRRSTTAEIAASRARGAAAGGFTPGATKPHRAARQEEARMAQSLPTPVPEEQPGGGAPIGVLTPCEDCLHREVCRIRPSLTAEEIVVPYLRRDGVRIAAVSIECDHFLRETIRQPDPPPGHRANGQARAS